MIYYKIVTISRHSCSLTIGNKYCNEYQKGTIVKSFPNTLGIFCFEDRQFANEFYQDMYNYTSYQIIKVKGIGKKAKPKTRSFYINEFELDRFYKSNISLSSLLIPLRTVCFEAVEVLE